MTFFMGIDIGSRTSKGVIAGGSELKAHHTLASGVNYRLTAQKLREELLVRARLDAGAITRTVTTGHGAGTIAFSDRHVSDMQCCARGIRHVFPTARTVIDVQSQYSQVIQIGERGQVTNFAVSEACASGSGCYIEVIASVLRLELEDVGPISLKSASPVTFTTGCAVFGESEAISRLSEGISREDILAGVHQALAGKIAALIARAGLKEPCAISGGGALNVGLIKKVKELGIQLLVPPQPQIVNALGAALIAQEQATEK